MQKANVEGISTSDLNKSIKISGQKAGDVIFVDFYYKEEAYSTTTPPGPGPVPTPDPDPVPDPNEDIVPLAKKADAMLKFRSQNESGQKLENNTGDIAYVPASEYIRPYFETALYVPHTLTYSLTIDDNGNFGYNLKNLKTYMLEASGHAVTSTEIVGDIFSNVISGGGVNATLPDNNNFDKDVYKNLGIYATDIPVGD